MANPDGTARFLADALGVEVEATGEGIEAGGELNSAYGFRYRHFRAPDGRRFELLDRKL